MRFGSRLARASDAYLCNPDLTIVYIFEGLSGHEEGPFLAYVDAYPLTF